jgi:tetratricopeptide (TPR) repeat protein
MKLRKIDSSTTWPALGFSVLILAAMAFSGCANQRAATIEPAIYQPEPEAPERPFETQTLYSLLVAELAGSRDRLDIMLNNYVAQAVETQDIGVTERAAQLARFMEEPIVAQQMAVQWASLDADNPQARYMAMAALSDAGRYFEAFEHGEFLITNGHTPHGLDALVVKATNSGASDEELGTLLKFYANLQTKHPRDAELSLAMSFLRYQFNELDSALKFARHSQTQKTDYEQAYLQELRVLNKIDGAKAQLRLAEIVGRFPDNKRLRLQYARTLTTNNLPEAAEQFEELLRQSPGDNNIQLALALTYFQLDALDQAKAQFLPLEHGALQSPTANYYLGKIAQQQKDPQEAIRFYSQVLPSKEFLPAAARAFELFHELGQPEKALQLITGYQLTADSSYQEGLSLLLADHYKIVGDSVNAELAYNEGILLFPRSELLLFNRAMLLATQNRIEPAERDLITLLAINPNNADALNTLGYILADANIRVAQAMGYIERALELDPENAAVIDSLGWALYRLGQNDKALVHLRQAMQLMPNDEIAAHLGEVLWVQGQEDEAIRIWKQGLELNPNSRYIRERLERFNPGSNTVPKES